MQAGSGDDNLAMAISSKIAVGYMTFTKIRLGLKLKPTYL